MPRRTKQKKKVAQKAHHFAGQRLNISSVPPEFTSRPWFPLVVRMEGPGTSVQLSNLVDSLRTQLGLDGAQPVALRLTSVKVYGPLVGFNASSVLQPVDVGIHDFMQMYGNSSATNRMLEQYTRYPDQVRRACIGYRYPDAHRCFTLALATPPTQTILLSTTGLGSGTLILWYLHFRTGTNIPTRLEDDFDRLEVV